MNLRNSLSIRAKLIALALASATIAVTITGASMAQKEIIDLKTTKVEQLSSQARMIAFNSTGVLSFLDQEAAKQLLRSLEVEPTVDCACLYDAEGKLFASYTAIGKEGTLPIDPTLANCHKYDSKGNLEVYFDVTDQGIFLGNVMLRANSTDIIAKQRNGLLTILEFAVLSLALVAILSIYLQKGISDPIYQLSQTADKITLSADYSLRVKKTSNDELGNLCDAFNGMLSQVERSEIALTRAHNELEDRVTQRTAELEEVSRYNAAILDAALDAIITMDKEGRIVQWNPQATDVFGWDADEVLGKLVSEIIIPPALKQSHEKGFRRFLGTGEGHVVNQRIEINGVRRDGTEFPIELALVSVSEGNNQKFCGFIRDVTERRQTAEAMQEAKEVAENANKAKSEFLANMSHEIRTPLNGILGFADLMAQQGETIRPREREEYLSHIQVSGKHLLELINDILDLSKIESDRIEVELLDYSPHALLAEVVSLMRVRAQEKGLTLDSEWKGPLPKTIHTDPTRLRQVLVNLVGNAIKFTSEGSVRLVSQLKEQKDGTSRLVVEVIDSGIGIPEDKLETIFSPFTQADNSVTRNFGGTGLGLTISRKLAKALGGDLTIASQIGQGSTFTVSIDVGSLADTVMYDTPPGDGIAATERSKKIASTGHELDGARILLVEDGEINRKLIIALLTQAGVKTIDTAENGEIGVQKATANDYDLILLDMQMPVMDGYTAATTLRDQENRTPIIALTAHAMKGDKEKCLDAGCNDYLTKPIVANDLIRKIGNWLPTLAQANTSGETPVRADASNKTEELRSTLPTDNPVFLEIVQDFGDLLEDCLPRLRSAAENQEADQLESLAHSLLGTAGGAGFDDFTEPTRHLEKLARKSRFAEAMETLHTIEAIADRIKIPERALV